jgi:transcriptional regulator with XRE-family HTH domain
MNKRLKHVRKTLKLNQSEFAVRLGMAQSGYSQIETGENAILEKHIKLICYTFGINDQWLRTGLGDMFQKNDVAETDDEKELLAIFKGLSYEMQDIFITLGRTLYEKSLEKKDALPTGKKKCDITAPPL